MCVGSVRRLTVRHRGGGCPQAGVWGCACSIGRSPAFAPGPTKRGASGSVWRGKDGVRVRGRGRVTHCFAATVAVGALRLVRGVVRAASDGPPLAHQVPPSEELPDHFGEERTGARVWAAAACTHFFSAQIVCRCVAPPRLVESGSAPGARRTSREIPHPAPSQMVRAFWSNRCAFPPQRIV